MLADDPAHRPKTPREVARFLKRFAVPPVKLAEGNEETAACASLITPMGLAQRPLKNSSLNYIPVTESTPTLPCGTARHDTVAPSRHRSWVTAGLIVILLLACGFLYFSSGKSTPTLEDQVKQRIATERSLSGTAIRVMSDAPGTVTLAGSVSNLQQKQKAVHLAEHTSGVESVKDELIVK
jgi:hypothetical protein